MLGAAAFLLRRGGACLLCYFAGPDSTAKPNMHKPAACLKHYATYCTGHKPRTAYYTLS